MALETATQIGVSPLEFWDITPFELSLMIDAFIQNRKREEQNGLTLAWLNAGWQRAKKMPELDKVLKSVEEEPEQQEPEDMLAVIKALNAKFGGNVY